MPDQNPKQPVATMSKGTDRFQGFERKPMISSAGSQSRYLGRVVMEIWEPVSSTGRGDQVAYIVSPASGIKTNDLLQRAIKSLAAHLEKQLKQ
jgi:hypothetical protein